MRALALVGALVAPALIAAQSADSVQHLGADQLRRDAAALAAQTQISKQLGDRGAYTYMVAHRTSNGEVEVHSDWDDVMVIQEGAATMVHGGTAFGTRETTPGERRGGTIAGGQRQPLAKGDVLVIPAGVPHQYEVAKGGSVTYFVVKVRRAAGRQP